MTTFSFVRQHIKETLKKCLKIQIFYQNHDNRQLDGNMAARVDVALQVVHAVGVKV